jgi:hypothetical protein
MEKKGEGLLNGKKNDPIEKKKKDFLIEKKQLKYFSHQMNR